MDRREKRRRFHQAIIDMLYPPPIGQQPLAEEDPASAPSALVLNQIKDPEGSDSPSSSSGDDEEEEGEPGPHKLTRALRKKLRKKKLKESTSSSAHRRKIIGPLLPSAVNEPEGDNAETGEDRSQGVRQNASESYPQSTPPEECSAQKEGKLKRRRMAKKLARENILPSHHLQGCDKDGESAKR